jgi:predicted RND superfamily exporter protein
MKKLIFIFTNILLLFGAVIFVKRSINPFDLLNAINENHPIYQEFQEFQRKYGNKETLTVALDFKKKFLKDSSAIFKIEKISNDIKNLSPQIKVNSLTSSSYYTLSKGLFKLKYFFDEKKKSLQFPENLFHSPLYKNIFWDKTKQIALLYLQTKRGPSELKMAINYLNKIKDPSFEIHLFGHGYFQHVVREESLRGQLYAIPLFIFITFSFFRFVFKSHKVALAALYIIGISYISTLMLAIFKEGTISPFGSLALLISFVMGVTDLIHYFYFPKKSASFKIITPCFYTSLTTIVGLLSLCISQIKPVFNFGIFGAFAVFISFMATFFILPFVIKLFNIAPEKPLFLSRSGLSLYQICVRKKGWIILVFSLLIIFFTQQIKKITFKENFLNQIKKTHQFSRSANFFREKLQFSGTLDLLLFQKREQFFSPDFFKIEKDIKNDLLKHPSIINVHSLLNIKEDLQLRSELSKQNINILEQFSFFDNFLPPGSDEARIVITLKDQDSQQLKSIFHFINKTFKQKKYARFVSVKVGGYSKVRYQIMNFLFKTFYGSLFLSFGGIFICFLFLFRSFKLALLGMLPNIIPVFIISGLQGFLGIGVNFYLVLLNCIVLGLSVDDTIHFLYHYDQHKSDLKHFLPIISPPLIMTTLLLCTLFTLFTISAFISFSQVALFLCMAFLIALLADLLLLPSLLLLKRPSS